MWFMKEKPKIKAVDINHDGFLLAYVTSLISVELQVAVFIEALVLLSCRYIVQDINLRGDLGMMWDELYFFYVDYSVEL